MGTASSIRCGVVAASLGVIAQLAAAEVQLSSVNASVWGECWDRRVMPWVYRSYSETADRLPIEMGGSIRSDVVDMGSGVSMRGVASTNDVPMQYSVIFGEGGAAVVSSAAGMEVRCSVNLRSTFAMTVPAWVELQTRGLGLLELRDDHGNLARQLSGDQVVRMYLDHGFWSISGTVNIENAATGDGLFRFAIPSPGAISLLGAGAVVLATAWRRR